MTRTGSRDPIREYLREQRRIERRHRIEDIGAVLVMTAMACLVGYIVLVLLFTVTG